MSDVKYYFFTQKISINLPTWYFLLKHYHSNCQLTLIQSFDLPIVTSTRVARPYQGFRTLCKVEKQIWDLRIILNTHDISKWNYSGLVNHACKKPESEIHKLAPEGGTITQDQLIQATILLNSLIRRKGTECKHFLKHCSKWLQTAWCTNSNQICS